MWRKRLATSARRTSFAGQISMRLAAPRTWLILLAFLPLIWLLASPDGLADHPMVAGTVCACYIGSYVVWCVVLKIRALIRIRKLQASFCMTCPVCGMEGWRVERLGSQEGSPEYWEYAVLKCVSCGETVWATLDGKPLPDFRTLFPGQQAAAGSHAATAPIPPPMTMRGVAMVAVFVLVTAAYLTGVTRYVHSPLLCLLGLVAVYVALVWVMMRVGDRGAACPPPMYVQAWPQMKLGMTHEQVRSLLGEPTVVIAARRARPRPEADTEPNGVAGAMAQQFLTQGLCDPSYEEWVYAVSGTLGWAKNGSTVYFGDDGTVVGYRRPTGDQAKQ